MLIVIKGRGGRKMIATTSYEGSGGDKIKILIGHNLVQCNKELTKLKLKKNKRINKYLK